jgi:predicted AlkP superfamily phosphohydrolase/phosphomutase
MSAKVCVIGLDCAAPELVFETWRDRLPNLRRIMQAGVYGPLESTIPPITVPAWMCMMTGRDPGELGLYGFRNRRDRSYEGQAFASNRMVRLPALWDVLGDQGRKSIVLGVPLTYPPRPIHGLMVTDFLAPSTESDYTYPPELKAEIREVVGEYLLDAREFRMQDRDVLLAEIHTMTQRRFALARHLIATKPWDLFVMVEMGPDRMHHAFWRYLDPLHVYYEPDSQFTNAIRDYYEALDAEIGALLKLLDADTRVLVVSDHGAKRMDGGLCFNEWLLREGYLVLRGPVEGVTKLTPDLVDWSRTRAWGDGGYYGRLFLNVRGREPEGIVEPGDIEALKGELEARLSGLTDERGQPLGNRVFRPEAVYRRCENIPPDLIVYFGDLHWRSVGSIGHETIWTHTNDTGPDDANHAQQGIFLMAEAGNLHSLPVADLRANRREELSIYDVAPTVLAALGITPPPGMGRSVVTGSGPPPQGDSAYTAEEEAELARRLEDLGYL